MRSSKNRSRSKGNRNRSVGNIVNRVFDSSGPEGKVRGTPQQIIDKYNQLARDAQLGNDRVAFENFQQHAEHYLRMLAEAQREMDARRDQQQQQDPSAATSTVRTSRTGEPADGTRTERNQQDRPAGASLRRPPAGAERPTERPPEPMAPPTGRDEAARLRRGDRPAGDQSDEDSTLVETPENAPKPRRSRSRRPRKGDGDARRQDARRCESTGTPKGDDGGPSREAAE
jgi:sRNA-binding protein